MENKDYNEQLIELLTKYENKKIDDKTYQEEYAKLLSQSSGKIVPTVPKITLKGNLLYIIVLAVILIIFAYNTISSRIGREFIKADLHNIDEPIQREYNSIDDITLGSVVVEVDLNYYYELSGKVVATFRYLPFTVGNRISPLDVGIVWGDLMEEENLKKTTWKELGNRRLSWHVKDSSWYEARGGIEGLYSNNHLVPSNKEVRKQILKIKKGDNVKITGYLVNMYWDEGKSSHSWESSTTRYDQGDGACELIYVTDIKWLKQKA